jgi:hypothetical protein
VQPESTLEKIEAKYRMLAPMMDERMRRQWAASEAQALKKGSDHGVWGCRSRLKSSDRGARPN